MVGAWKWNRVTNEVEFSPELASLAGHRIDSDKSATNWLPVVPRSDLYSILRSIIPLTSNSTIQKVHRILNPVNGETWVESEIEVIVGPEMRIEEIRGT